MKRNIEQISRTLGETELALCRLQGNIFAKAYLCGIPLQTFTGNFMSSTAAMFDRNQDYINSANLGGDLVRNFVIAVLALTGDGLGNYSPLEVIETDELNYAFWLGFIYRCEQLMRCVSSRDIIGNFPESFMRISYKKIVETGEIHLPDDAEEICRRLDILNG